MKVAVLSDIHGNLPALLEVTDHIERWKPDRVFVAGDIVNRGPRPLECLEIILKKERNQGWLSTRGNHEDYVIYHSKPEAPDSGPYFELYRNSFWTYQQLNCDVSSLKALPFQISQQYPKAGELRVTHASMQGLQEGIYTFTKNGDLKRKISPPPAIICVGHTHRPLVRHVGKTVVVNSGSVGLPFDGDPRSSYAQITWAKNRWQSKIIRLPYDRKEAELDFYRTGYLREAGPLARLVLVELNLAHSQLYQWNAIYKDPFLHGKISLTDSVRQFMQNPNTRYV
jgi:putative phosphoesterase